MAGKVGNAKYLHSPINAVSSQPDTEDESTNHIFRFKILKQIFLVGMWFFMGLQSEIVGPTLPDLKDRIGIDYEEMGRALMGSSFGLMLGSILGGFLHDRWPRFTIVFIAVGFLVSGTCWSLLTWIRSLWVAALFFAIKGANEGLVNTGGNTLVIHLWGEKVASPMMSLHFGWGLAGMISPQIVRPFLGADVRLENVTRVNTTNSTFAAPSISRIEIPYTIFGVASVLFGLSLLAFHRRGQPEGFPQRKPTKNVANMLSPSRCAPGKSAVGLSLLVTLAMYFFQAVGGERAYGKYIFSYAIETEVRLTKDSAAWLNTLFWISFVCGRGLGVIMGRFIPIKAMIVIDIVGTLVCTVGLAVAGHNNPIVLWVFTGFLGFFLAQIFPNGVSWSSIYLDMTASAIMLLLIGGSCGGFVYHYLPGYLFDEYGPETLMYVMVAYSLCLVIIYITMEIFGRFLENRFETPYAKSNQTDVEETKL